MTSRNGIHTGGFWEFSLKSKEFDMWNMQAEDVCVADVFSSAGELGS